MEAWSGFFIAQVGASAALAGLIFVSVSLSLAKIIALPHLPMRAFQALVVLLEILVISSLAIAPQPVAVVGAEVLVIGGAVWTLVIFFDWKTFLAAGKEFRVRALFRVALSQIAAAFFVIAGATILAVGIGGMHWLVPAIICSYLIAMVDAWVLLIEINR
jgi:hypothetical protein